LFLTKKLAASRSPRQRTGLKSLFINRSHAGLLHACGAAVRLRIRFARQALGRKRVGKKWAFPPGLQHILFLMSF
jgi:hypothetical protein